MSARGTTLVGAIVAILIIGAVASIGYYQFEFAPGLTSTSTSTTSQNAVNCAATPGTCVMVTIVSGASGTPPGYAPGSTALYGYSPATIIVVMGHNNTVVWTNNDTAFHTATSVSGPAGGAFDSLCLDGIGAPCPTSRGANSFQFTFTVAGTYDYRCTYHPWMQGKVIVLRGSGSSPTVTSST